MGEGEADRQYEGRRGGTKGDSIAVPGTGPGSQHAVPTASSSDRLGSPQPRAGPEPVCQLPHLGWGEGWAAAPLSSPDKKGVFLTGILGWVKEVRSPWHLYSPLDDLPRVHVPLSIALVIEVFSCWRLRSMPSDP